MATRRVLGRRVVGVGVDRGRQRPALPAVRRRSRRKAVARRPDRHEPRGRLRDLRSVRDHREHAGVVGDSQRRRCDRRRSRARRRQRVGSDRGDRPPHRRRLRVFRGPVGRPAHRGREAPRRQPAARRGPVRGRGRGPRARAAVGERRLRRPSMEPTKRTAPGRSGARDGADRRRGGRADRRDRRRERRNDRISGPVHHGDRRRQRRSAETRGHDRGDRAVGARATRVPG